MPHVHPRINPVCHDHHLLRSIHFSGKQNRLGIHASPSHAQLSRLIKSGHIPEAEDMLQSIGHRDVVSWNILLGGYASQHGLNHKAFECFYRMQAAESISPNPVTFISILKACASSRSKYVCKNMHLRVLSSGFLQQDVVLCTALVDMYAQSSMMDEADELFCKLPEKNVFTWTALIAGYAKLGLGDIALKWFLLMRDEGNSPNVVTFTCALKACASIGSLDVGKDIHAEVKHSGLLETDIVLGNTLVDMYVKCGELWKAEEVFQELSQRNVFSWSILITGYLENGLSNEALKCFRQMRAEGIFPNVVTFVCVLKACSSIGLNGIGKEIHVEINEHGFLKVDTIIGTALVDMYAKCGMLQKAQEILEELPEPDTVCWSALIAGYVHHGLTDEALECFSRMRDEGVVPNAVTYTCILNACGNGGVLEIGKNIHAELKQKDLLEKDLILGIAVMDMYAKCGMLGKAHEIFAELPVQSLVAWCVLITGYVQHGLGDVALKCFRMLRHSCLSLDSVAFICGLKACGSIGHLEAGEEIHAEIKELGSLEKEIEVGSALVDMYVKCCAVEKAQEVFQMLSEQNVVQWNILMSGYAQQHLSGAAMRHFKQMQEESVFADVVTYICVLKACGSVGSVSMVKAIHTKVKEQGLLKTNMMLGNTLIDMYAECGLLEKAAEVFEELPYRDSVSWNSLIAGHAQMGQAKMVFELLNRMRDETIMPNVVSSVILLYVCSHAGLVEEGHMVFSALCDVHKPGPVELYTCMIDLLGRAGDFDNAKLVADKMPFADYHPLLSALLGACRTWINVELGRWTFEELIQLDQMYGAAYICMENVYKAAGMHMEAERVEARRVKNNAC